MNIAESRNWRSRIKAAGVTFRQVAKEAGVHEMTLYSLLKGINKSGRSDTVEAIEKTIRKFERKRKKLQIEISVI